MKKTRLFSLALAALMLGACSSEDIVVNEGDVAPGEKGFVSFSFNLPTTPSTRANDNFEDGLPVEYNVKDATLLLFAGNTEDESTFQSAYDLSLPSPDDVNYNVTTRYTIIKDIEKPQKSGNIYALVILNGKNSGVISNNGGSWILNGAALDGSTTFKSLYTTARTLEVDQIANTSDDGYFLMTNAPMFTAPGGAIAPNGNVQTLSVIDSDRIYGTADEARANPATDIYCERVVAKVTVTDETNHQAVSGTQIASYTFDGWTLDITSKRSYFVRNVDCTGASWWTYKADRSSDYRFVGSVGLTNTATQTLYRTYWAKDPTYSTGSGQAEDVDTINFNTTINKIPTSPLTKMGDNAYCLENTFNVANQNQNQTTRVVVAAKLVVNDAASDGSFFILNDNKDVIYGSKAEIETIVTTAYLNVPAVRQFLTTALKENNKLENSDLNVTFSQSGAGYWDVEKIEVNVGAKDRFKGDAIPEELQEGNALYTKALASVNADYNIAYYAGGVSYYGARIRHFDEAQTPWTEDGKINNSYPGPNAEENYLGRYGVLRNNWYEVNVTAIKNIGSPIPDEVYGQDDPLEKWISVRINVLSWAKRTQDVEL